MAETLAQRLKATRTARGLTQDDLADASGVSQSAIGMLESGSRDGSTKIAEIAHALGVHPYWLVTGKGPRDDPSIDEATGSVIDLMQSMSLEWRGTTLKLVRALHASEPEPEDGYKKPT